MFLWRNMEKLTLNHPCHPFLPGALKTRLQAVARGKKIHLSIYEAKLVYSSCFSCKNGDGPIHHQACTCFKSWLLNEKLNTPKRVF